MLEATTHHQWRTSKTSEATEARLMPKPFTARETSAIDAIKYLYIRAGDDHRFIPIWVVVVDGRVFVRPWNDKATGWYRTFLKTPRGAIKVNDKAVSVRAKPAKGEKLNDAVDAAYAAKYTTKANQRYVKGFATDKRRAAMLEVFPAS
jgi:hypothetical protein